MAKVKIEDVVDHLDSEFMCALEETIKMHFPDKSFDRRELFRTFKRNIYRKCNTWEDVPDNFVEK
ncbi:hypothetical protein [uncultured Bacteroides sp.]|uniref:hypothetical protein n=1 Tax=uncultured Bacteroides sp. TaxID=162156 RepID=UPI002AAB1E3D|nr:hypothetical protein [uncultured Bacteroides sp.]